MHFATLSVCNKITAVMFISRAEGFSNKPQGGEAEGAKLL